jgi:SulP family sulfate permease
MGKKSLAMWFRLIEYDRTLLRRDVVAGLTVATVAVPQAMAYALLAGVPPLYGLHTAIVVTALGALFGSSAYLINGPTTAMSLVVFGVLAGTGSGQDDSARIGEVALLAALAGLVQIALALLRLGDLGRHIPEVVLLGFMAAAGLLEGMTQIPTALGLRPGGLGEDHFPRELWLTWSRGGPPDVAALAICLSTVALLGGLRLLSARLKVKLPEMLLSLGLVSLLVGLLGLAPAEGQAGLRHVAGGLPTPRLPVPPTGGMLHAGALAGGALAIALLGLAEAVAMAKSLAARSGQQVDYNRQCLAQGLANLGGGLFGCLPGSASLSRSTINYHSGAATRLSGVLSAAAVAVALWLFAPLVGRVPPSALAGVLLWTAWSLVDPRRLWDRMRCSRVDAAVVLSTVLVAVLVGIEFAVLAGIAASCVCRVTSRDREGAGGRLRSLTVAARKHARGVPPPGSGSGPPR